MGNKSTNRRNLFLGGILSLLLFILSAGLLEGGLRMRHWIKYGTSTRTVFSFTKDRATGLRIPAPRSTTGGIRINSLGFRSPELDTPKPQSAIRLAFLGASTTFSAEVTSNEATWPHLVWNRLQATYPDIRIDYVNAGVPGYGISHSLVNLEHRIKPLTPDVIIIYHAANDLSYDTRQLARQQGIYVPERDKKSWLAEWSLTWFLIKKNLQVLARQRGATTGKNRLIFDPSKLSEGFRQELARLILVSKRVAPVVAVATFSKKFRRDQSEDEQLKAANTALYYNPYMSLNGLLDAYDEYNHVIREVGKETNVILIEAEFSIPGDDIHFNDSVHFTDTGSEVMARVVVETLMQSQRLQELMKSGRIRRLE